MPGRSLMVGRTLITGGAGFIGSHLARRLVDEGREVVVIDDYSRGSRQNLIDLGFDREFFKTCVREVNLINLYAAVSSFEDVDTVFHLAAKMGGIETLHGSEEIELKTLQDNLRIDANVFQLCRDNNVKKIIYASSVAVYPTDKMVFKEDDFDFTNPDGSYGWAKAMGEYQLSLMPDVQVGIARIFNVYGEGDATDETANVVIRFIKRAIQGKDLIVYDGMQTRCYLYISDCIDALMKMEKIAGHGERVMNIASDKFISIKELAEKIVEISGKKLEIKHDFGKPVGPWSRIAKIERAKSVLGWKPTISLNEGLTRTYDYYKDKL